MTERSETAAPKALLFPPELVAEARAGDQAAFTELYELTHLELYRSIRSMVRDEDLTWDLLQDSYLRAWRGLDKLEANEAFLPWLRRIAVNVTATRMAKKLPLSFAELAGEEDAGEPELPDLNADNQPELALDRKETSRLVREIIAELPEQQQMIIGMHYYEDMPIRDIAETLQLAPGTVKAQLFKGRKNVESRVRALEKQGVKLYGLGPLPFLLALLHKLEPAAETERKALGPALAQSAAAEGAQITALTAGQALFHGLWGKLLAGALTLVLIGGGFWVGSRLRKSAAPEIGIVRPTTVQEISYSEPSEPSEPRGEFRLRHELPDPSLTEKPAPDASSEPTEPTDPTDPAEPSEAPAPPIPAAPGPVAPPPPSEPPEPTEPTEPSQPPENPANPENPEPADPTEPAEPADPTEPIGPADPTEPTDPTEPPAELITGECGAEGSNLTWSLNPETGELIIEGSGQMQNYGRSLVSPLIIISSSTPWGEYDIPITKLSVSAGVESIGSNAFKGCSQLTSVTLPEGLQTISGEAFSHCTSLTELTLPESLTSLASSAFNESGLSNIEIPAATAITGNAIDCAALGYISVASDNPYYSSYDGLLYNKDMTNLLFCPLSRSGTVTIPEGVTSVTEINGCNQLTAVILPESLLEIHGFNNCKLLTEITIPKNVRTIDLANEDTSPSSLNSRNTAFSSMESLQSLQVDPDNPWFSSVDGVLYDKAQTVLLRCPQACEGVLLVPDGVKEIGAYAFYNCTGLSGVTLPDFLTDIHAYAFYGCSSLLSIEFKDSLKELGQYTFYGCGQLQAATFHSKTTAIGAQAFSSSSKKLTIYGPFSSTAESFAASNKIPFVAINTADPLAPRTSEVLWQTTR